MQAWQWYVLNADGTVDLDVSGDPAKPDIVRLPRANLGNIRRFGLMLEAADDKIRVYEEGVRSEVGMTAEANELLARLRTEGEQTMESVLMAPDLVKMESEYAGRLQVYLLSPENPYPPIYVAMLAEMGYRVIDDDDLPMWALGQAPIAAILEHWQTAPLALGTADPLPLPMPRRQPRDRQPKS